MYGIKLIINEKFCIHYLSLFVIHIDLIIMKNTILHILRCPLIWLFSLLARDIRLHKTGFIHYF